MKSWKTPTTKEIDQAIGLLNQPAQKSYFFNNLKNPLWVEALYKKGFFKNPPVIKRNEKEGTIQFPIWPESKFLARIAGDADVNVITAIIKDLKTDNVRVKEDILEIISKLPSDKIISLYKNAIKYIDDPYTHFSLVPQKIGDIIEKLISERKTEEAIEIAKYVLRPIAESQSEEAKKLGLHANPKPKFEIWNYEEIINKKLIGLKDADPLKLFNLLVELLYTAIQVSRGYIKDDADTEDHLYITRRDVREQPQFHSHELESLLISEIISAADHVIKTHPEQFEEVLKLLESKKYNFYKKIAVYLLAEHPDLDQSRISSYSKNRELFDAGWISSEYEYLLSHTFNSLSVDDKKLIITWIETGPDLETFKDTRKSWSGKDVTEEEALKYKEIWQLQHLHVIKDFLDKTLKDKYEELAIKYPGFDEKIKEGVFYAANESPKTNDELRGMTAIQVVSLLKEWKQTGDGFNGKPTKEGLGIALREVIKERPVEFSELLDEVALLDSTYLFSILIGIENGLSVSKEINWDKTVNLLSKIFSADHNTAAGGDDDDSFDGSARRQALSLLNAGLRVSGFKLEHREKIWTVIQNALTDPDPTIDQDEKHEDEITLAINSIRGEALHSVIEYALWLRRLFEKMPNAKDLIANGFTEMSEVKKTLDNYLKLDIEPTRAIRSVYGRYLPWLHLLDPKWVSLNLDKIFSHTEKAHGNGAWAAHITLNQVYDNLLPVLNSELHFRLMNPEFPAKEEKQSLREPNERLVEHIISYYWRSKLNLHDQIIIDLVENADVRLLSHAISFIGRVIYGEKDTPSEILKRFSEFWEYVVSKVKNNQSRAAALEGYTWWFASNKFDSTWLLDNLELTIDTAKQIDSEDFVLDNLMPLSKDFPEKSVVLLEKILAVASKPWIAHSSEKEIIEILKNAQASQSTTAKEAVKRIVNSLAKKELFKFLDILN